MNLVSQEEFNTMKLLVTCIVYLLIAVPVAGQTQDSCITKINVVVYDINAVNANLVRLFIVSYYYNDTLYCIENKRAKKKGIEYYDYIEINAYLDCYDPQQYFYDINRRLIAIANYSGEFFYGGYQEFYPNGNTRIEGAYEHGRKIGTWKYYDNEFQLTKEETYENGILINTVTY